MFMKLKTKQFIIPADFVFILAYAVIIFLVLLTMSHTMPNFIWKEFWADLLVHARQKDPVAYLALLALPWAVAIGLVWGVWQLISRGASKTKGPRVASVSFEKDGVQLEYQNPHRRVFLPYATTDLTVRVPVRVQYNRRSQTVCALDPIEITFSAEGASVTVPYRGTLSFLQKLLDEGKKFRSCTASAQLGQPAKSPSACEQKMLQFVQEQLENHRRYGLMRREFPQQRLSWWATSAVLAGLALAQGIIFLPVMIRLHAAWPLKAFLGGLIGVLLAGAGFFLRKLWVSYAIQKRLDALNKENLP